MVVTKPRRRTSSTLGRRRRKTSGICLEGKLSDYLNTKGADVLWGSNIRLTENELQEILPESSPTSSSERNVITECAMCNEELTTNHVCREYLERLQPHFSTVPKGGHEITLTQTSEECRKNLSSLENGIYDEDESNLFHFNPPAAHIDVIAKTEYDNESSVDNINVSVSTKTTSTQSSEQKLHSIPFSTSWISAVYSKDLFTYDQYQAMLSQRAAYCYPILTKLESTGGGGGGEGGGGSGESLSSTTESDLPPSVTMTTEFYHPAPVHTPPKFVRSVKRLKREAYFNNDYNSSVDHCDQSTIPKDSPDLQYSDQRSYPRTKKRTIYPTSYKSAQATKNSSVGSGDARHEEASHNDSQQPQPRKKRKYVRRTTKEEQIENGTALWQFLMRKLEDQRCRGWIRWTGNDLEFKVLDQKEAAKQWGLCKKRTKMTFDKFSRSMRFYYSKGILVHNPDKRLTYIFCRQPHDPVYTEMLERVMKTLPPNTIHCTATCINPAHDHEKIKLLVRKRPKKTKVREPENPASRGDSGSDSPIDCGSRVSIGLQCDSDQEQEYSDMRGSLIPEYVIPYQEHGTGSPPYSGSNMTDSGFCSSSPYSDYRRRSEQELYNSSPMAALIAAASQAVAVPIPGTRLYPPMEVSSAHQTTPPPYTPPHTSVGGVPSTPPCGTPQSAPDQFAEMILPGVQEEGVQYEELRSVEGDTTGEGFCHDDDDDSNDKEDDVLMRDLDEEHDSDQNVLVESSQDPTDDFAVQIISEESADQAGEYVPETQISDSEDSEHAVDLESQLTVIPETQNHNLTSNDQSQSLLPDSQTDIERTEVAPQTQSLATKLPASVGDATDNSVESITPEFQGRGHSELSNSRHGPEERTTRISQDSGFCEISQNCAEDQSHL